MKMIKLQDLAQIEISNVDKKSIEGETSVKLCNFVDVYYGSKDTPSWLTETVRSAVHICLKALTISTRPFTHLEEIV